MECGSRARRGAVAASPGLGLVLTRRRTCSKIQGSELFPPQRSPRSERGGMSLAAAVEGTSLSLAQQDCILGASSGACRQRTPRPKPSSGGSAPSKV